MGLLGVVEALDSARTQGYHLIVVAITGIGFFTEAYDLFCIFIISQLLGRLYYFNGKLPQHLNNLVLGVVPLGSLFGHLFFGFLSDKLGRKKLYNLTLILILFSSICSAFSFASSPNSLIYFLCFFRFWLGFGIGGDNTLSATIMSEYANKQTRGAFLAAVFANQGYGFLCAACVSLICSGVFRSYTFDAPPYNKHSEAEFLWRMMLLLEAVPALMSFYWRMKMPETGRYTALIQGNAEQAAEDMASVLDIEIIQAEKKLGDDEFFKVAEYSLLSKEFIQRHGLHLIGTMSTWFFSSRVFYTQLNLTQKLVVQSIGRFTVEKKTDMNALEEVFESSSGMFVIAVSAIFPGYWFTFLFIEKLGRFKIQFFGFYFILCLTFLIGMMVVHFEYQEIKHILPLLYGLTLFFANFGPNCTAFVMAAELFPTRLRSTCHALSAAAGKLGAILGTLEIQNSFNSDGDTKKIVRIMQLLTLTTLLGILFTSLLPETGGRSLEEISGERITDKKVSRDHVRRNRDPQDDDVLRNLIDNSDPV